MKALAVAVLCAALTGCVSTAQVRSHAPETFTLQLPAKQVHKAARTMVRDCYSGSIGIPFAVPMNMEDDFDDDTNAGTVRLVLKGGLGDQVQFVIDTKPAVAHELPNAYGAIPVQPVQPAMDSTTVDVRNGTWRAGKVRRALEQYINTGKCL